MKELYKIRPASHFLEGIIRSNDSTFTHWSHLHKSIEGSSDQGGRLRIQCHIHDDLNIQTSMRNKKWWKQKLLIAVLRIPPQVFEGDKMIFVFILCCFCGNYFGGKLSDATDYLQFPQLLIHWPPSQTLPVAAHGQHSQHILTLKWWSISNPPKIKQPLNKLHNLITFHVATILLFSLVIFPALECASGKSCSVFPVIAKSQTFTEVPPPEAYNAAFGKGQPHSTGLPWSTSKSIELDWYVITYRKCTVTTYDIIWHMHQ